MAHGPRLAGDSPGSSGRVELHEPERESQHLNGLHHAAALRHPDTGRRAGQYSQRHCHHEIGTDRRYQQIRGVQTVQQYGRQAKSRSVSVRVDEYQSTRARCKNFEQ